VPACELVRGYQLAGLVQEADAPLRCSAMDPLGAVGSVRALRVAHEVTDQASHGSRMDRCIWRLSAVLLIK